MRKVIVILLILLMGCVQGVRRAPRMQRIPRMPVNYMVINDQAGPVLTRADLARHPLIGIAFISANPDLIPYVKQVVGRFAVSPLVYYDVSLDASFNDDGPEISVQKLSAQYPDMRYVIVINEVPINTEQICEKHTGGMPGSFFPRCDANREKKITDEYKTVYEAKLDVLLLDLNKKLLLAMSSDNFSKKESHFDTTCQPKNEKIVNILIKTLLVGGRCSGKKYPQVTHLDGKKVGYYVYNFLDQIHLQSPR